MIGGAVEARVSHIFNNAARRVIRRDDGSGCPYGFHKACGPNDPLADGIRALDACRPPRALAPRAVSRSRQVHERCVRLPNHNTTYRSSLSPKPTNSLTPQASPQGPKHSPRRVSHSQVGGDPVGFTPRSTCSVFRTRRRARADKVSVCNGECTGVRA
ncbi:hypothetical protein BD310DRAFT_490462 [Dichomitus squalens]|uniref:Uncharacterized protein n=1 Tax=Dichomitus squalens TaxID=114155 RepID=A0A4V2K819_9APHY|nr:hypothetical protein BD310DRAFT_490462 [Dichomitus squalens]